MSLLPALIIVVLLVGMFLLTKRNRQRAAIQEQERKKSITFGTDVMTTSGLYGTVVGINDDETVQLSISPGVEVKFALAALRDISSLPDQYKQGIVSLEKQEEDRPDDRPER
jgi:preprotein translocase subunit YajC